MILPLDKISFANVFCHKIKYKKIRKREHPLSYNEYFQLDKLILL